ncbi:hypothetical protein BT96DRAFT_929253 [Gymnopus androsaceus JB14]|uniref:Uncharacterized protein n=1 Tax=Gymnopus androsaceus JB14 TaxID=1447944 RepID=A0A6A4GG87_9AGAR|nr:hypothetical protein BT96DRAFT_929253 [Gymnopus androsaceus JB14]
MVYISVSFVPQEPESEIERWFPAKLKRNLSKVDASITTLKALLKLISVCIILIF